MCLLNTECLLKKSCRVLCVKLLKDIDGTQLACLHSLLGHLKQTDRQTQSVQSWLLCPQIFLTHSHQWSKGEVKEVRLGTQQREQRVQAHMCASIHECTLSFMHGSFVLRMSLC